MLPEPCWSPSAGFESGSEMREKRGIAVFASMVMLRGSSSSNPFSPWGAVMETWPLMERFSCPETSTCPPLPLFVPPLLSIVPAKVVDCSDQTTTVPPLPVSRALALRLLLFVITVLIALAREGFLPCQPPPMRIIPPPVFPSDIIRVPAMSVCGAVMKI